MKSNWMFLKVWQDLLGALNPELESLGVVQTK